MELRGFDDSPEKEARGSQPPEQQQQRQRQDEQYRYEAQHRQEKQQHRQEQQQQQSRKAKEQQLEERKRAECKYSKDQKPDRPVSNGHFPDDFWSGFRTVCHFVNIQKPDKNCPIFEWSCKPRLFYIKENILYV
jgi:hypothetical protein